MIECDQCKSYKYDYTSHYQSDIRYFYSTKSCDVYARCALHTFMNLDYIEELTEDEYLSFFIVNQLLIYGEKIMKCDQCGDNRGIVYYRHFHDNLDRRFGIHRYSVRCEIHEFTANWENREKVIRISEEEYLVSFVINQ
jgi:hypothetical protein